MGNRILAVICIAIAVCFFALAGQLFPLSHLWSGWLQADGEVQSTRIIREPRREQPFAEAQLALSYVYQVGDRTLNGEEIVAVPRWMFDPVFYSASHLSRPVCILYDGRNPNSSIVKDAVWPAVQICVIAALLFLILAALLFFNILNPFAPRYGVSFGYGINDVPANRGTMGIHPDD